MYRVLKRDSHFYLFTDQETMFVAKPLAEAAGFKFWKPIVWEKQKIGMGYHYRSQYELILFFEGKRKLADLGVADVSRSRVSRGYPGRKTRGALRGVDTAKLVRRARPWPTPSWAPARPESRLCASGGNSSVRTSRQQRGR